MLKEHNVVRPSNGQAPKKIAFIQCVGSRDRQIGNEYCSKVCCGIASKQAIELRQQLPDSRVMIFYIDMRMYDYWENEIYWPAQEKYKVNYVKGVISEVLKKGDQLLIRGEDTTISRPMEVTMDMAVLSVGMEPSAGTRAIAQLMGVQQNKYGFIEASGEPGSRIYLRLLLATAETGANTVLAKSQSNASGLSGGVRIKGMPEEIAIKSENQNLRLSHEAVSTQTITNLLKSGPITVHTVVALENLRRCVIDTPQVCARLQADALNWLTVAANNPRSSNDYRAIVFRDTAMLNAYQGDYHQALQYMEKAAELDPDVLAYRLAKTEYLIRTGHLDRAKSMLDALQLDVVHSPRYSAANRETLGALAGMYAQAVEKSRQPTSHNDL